tara:strand:+ start:55284 stop:55607 length:324 start_codon:yes stop_codon:yes gene_type:complete
MQVRKETILNVFPGANEQHRLVLAQATTICGLEHLVLRQETHSSDVGWFVQSCVAIEPDQVAALKMTLSPNSLACNHSASVTPSMQRCRTASPKVLQFAEAASKQAS